MFLTIGFGLAFVCRLIRQDRHRAVHWAVGGDGKIVSSRWAFMLGLGKAYEGAQLVQTTLQDEEDEEDDLR